MHTTEFFYSIHGKVTLTNPSQKIIALFDLIGTFIIAYLLESYITTFFKIKRDTYYLSLIPLGILIHYFIKQDTFLNNQLMNRTLNIYKIVLVLLLYYLYKSLN